MLSDIPATFAALAHEGHVRWVGLREDHTMHGMAFTPVALRNAADASLGGWNCYVQLNPCPPNVPKRPKAQDISALKYILIDLDPGEHVDFLPYAVWQKVLDLVTSNLKAEPTTIFSGRGWQGWLECEPIDFVKGYYSRASVQEATSRLLRSLASAFAAKHGDESPPCRIDTSTSDLSRIARLPASFNQRTHRQARFVSLGSSVLTTYQLMSFLPNGWEEPKPIPVMDNDGDEVWQKVFHQLTRRAQDFILTGAEKGDRHASLWHTAKKLRELGVSMTSAYSALLTANATSNPPLDVDEVQRRVREHWRHHA